MYIETDAGLTQADRQTDRQTIMLVCPSYMHTYIYQYAQTSIYVCLQTCIHIYM